MKHFLVIVTCADKKEAELIAKAVVRKKLAACANVLTECKSFFKWKGKFEECDEVVVLIKTTALKYAALEKQIRGLHSYENPEVIAVPIEAGSRDYLKWVESTR